MRTTKWDHVSEERVFLTRLVWKQRQECWLWHCQFFGSRALPLLLVCRV